MARKREIQEVTKAMPHAGGYPRCSWNANDIQCRYPGTMSSSSEGSGPWFCRIHFDCKDAAFGAKVVDASRGYEHQRPGVTEADQLKAQAYCQQHGLDTLQEKRAYIRKLVSSVGRKPPSTAWADRILERIDAGEQLPLAAELMAKEVVG